MCCLTTHFIERRVLAYPAVIFSILHVSALLSYSLHQVGKPIDCQNMKTEACAFFHVKEHFAKDKKNISIRCYKNNNNSSISKYEKLDFSE
jgi:hypothetical protein